MATHSYQFPDVTLLVTHYNRSESLVRLLETFQKQGCTFAQIVVSDDGSRAEHLAVVQEYATKEALHLVTTPVNRGLGNNINKGQDVVTTPFTLYVQEDFVPMADFPRRFTTALQMMRTHDRLDIVRFYAYFKYPYLQPVNEGFSEMRFRLWQPGYRKFYMYSDHPHLRRSNFLTKFGRYTEGTKGDVTEYRMMMAFLQKKGQGLFYEEFQNLFEQKNSSDEPSTMKRNFWRESDNAFVTAMRHLYRHLRFNFDYLFKRFGR